MTNQEIIIEIQKIIDRNEIVHGFQSYVYQIEGGDSERVQRKIFFDGFDDGRNMMKIDLKQLQNKLMNESEEIHKKVK